MRENSATVQTDPEPDPLTVVCPICDAQAGEQCRRWTFPNTRTTARCEVFVKEPHWLRTEVAREEVA